MLELFQPQSISKKNINIIESFGERKFGIDKWEDLPENFGEKQFKDFNYKTMNGVSLNEVLNRELKALYEIIDTYSDKKILIVGHATALATLFSKWCEVSYTGPYKFNGNEFFNGKWNYCETFKLIFNDENELINIVNIK